jgi:GTP cyclohydrolase II
LSESADVRTAIAALRAGRPVGIGSATFAAVETATPELLDMLDPKRGAPLLISGQRAAALSLANAREAADPAQPVLITRAAWLNPTAALALANAGQDFSRDPVGPLQPIALADPSSSRAALALARAAGLLPALWLLGDVDTQVNVAAEAILDAPADVTRVATARLPLDGMPDTQVMAFRSASDGQEHVALVVGAFGGKPPLVRLHSECLTGDVFGSLKCDCGPQLKEALRIIAESGGGVLLYLRQEGRGIGIANKLRAYALQDRGLDTVDANRRLGFADDERGYAEAAAILRAIGVDAVQLLTNNPAKVEGLERAGINVIERVAHHMPTNPHNADYIAAKQAKSGHLA